MAFQAPVAFHDVVASFTVEQWMRMESWKKELYQNVVKEIHKTLLRLGYTIINPEVLFNIQKSDESCVRIDHSSAEREHKVIGDVPDLLLRVKEENVEEAHCSSEKPKIKDEKETSLLPKPSCPVISSVASLNVKEEQMVCEFGDATEPRQINNQDDNQLFIKQEEEVYLIDDYNTVGLETTVQDTPNPTATIKQEMDNRDHPFFPDIIPVVVKEECDPMEDVATGHHSTGDTVGSDEDKSKIAKTSVTLPRRRGGSPQAARILVDAKTKTARRIRMLEGTVKPFRSQPCFMNDPVFKGRAIPALKTVLRDIKSTSWCACKNCCVMETEEESVCCHGISALAALLNEETACIASHSFFQEMCLDGDRQDFLYRFWGQTCKKEEALDYIHKLRKTAYRAFTVWAYGFLDRRNCKPVPACVVSAVRASLPYPEELNVGFLKIYDYSAALMALG